MAFAKFLLQSRGLQPFQIPDGSHPSTAPSPFPLVCALRGRGSPTSFQIIPGVDKLVGRTLTGVGLTRNPHHVVQVTYCGTPEYFALVEGQTLFSRSYLRIIDPYRGECIHSIHSRDHCELGHGGEQITFLASSRIGSCSTGHPIVVSSDGSLGLIWDLESKTICGSFLAPYGLSIDALCHVSEWNESLCFIHGKKGGFSRWTPEVSLTTYDLLHGGMRSLQHRSRLSAGVGRASDVISDVRNSGLMFSSHYPYSYDSAFVTDSFPDNKHALLGWDLRTSSIVVHPHFFDESVPCDRLAGVPDRNTLILGAQGRIQCRDIRKLDGIVRQFVLDDAESERLRLTEICRLDDENFACAFGDCLYIWNLEGRILCRSSDGNSFRESFRSLAARWDFASDTFQSICVVGSDLILGEDNTSRSMEVRWRFCLELEVGVADLKISGLLIRCWRGFFVESLS